MHKIQAIKTVIVLIVTHGRYALRMYNTYAELHTVPGLLTSQDDRQERGFSVTQSKWKTRSGLSLAQYPAAT